MTAARNSYRQILRSSFIVGGATICNLLIGLARSKTVALILGPTGIGLIGLFQSLMAFGATVAGLGLRTVGTRQIAEAIGMDDSVAIGIARRALFWGTIALASIGAIVFWLMRAIVAAEVFHDPSLARDVGLLAIGVALTIGAGSQTALLAAFGRIGDLTHVGIASSIVATLLGCGILAWSPQGAVILFILVAPVATFIFGCWRIAKLKLAAPPPTPFAQIARQWLTMAKVGIALTITSVVLVGSEFFVRALIEQRLGPSALGQFYAAWTISSTYVTLVLSAIVVDYYPRLAAAISDDVAARRLLNEQSEIILLLAAPVLLAIVGLAPLTTQLLYSRDFSEAATVLRWQALGDVAMVVIWPLDYLFLARGQGVTYFWVVAIPIAIFLTVTSVTLSVFGVKAAGGAFLLMNIVHLALAHWLAWRRSGCFAWTPEVTRHFLALGGAMLFLFLIAMRSNALGGFLGIVLATAAAIYSISRFSRMVGGGAPERVVALYEMAKRSLGLNR